MTNVKPTKHSYDPARGDESLRVPLITMLEAQGPNGILRRLRLQPCYDLRAHPKNHGIHALEFEWSVSRSNFAIVWRLFTDWWSQDLRENWLSRFGKSDLPDGLGDLGYHSPVPMYEGQWSTEGCVHTGGGRCYYDGSVMQSSEMFELPVNDPAELWPELERRLEGLIARAKQEERDHDKWG